MGLLAVMASLSAHALLAAVAGVSLFALGGRAETPPANIEIDLAAPPAPPPETMPLAPTPPAEEPARLSTRRHAPPALAAAPAPAIAPPPPRAATPALDREAPPVLFAMSAGTVAARGPAPLDAVGALATSPSNQSGSSPIGVGVGVGVPAGDAILDAAAVDVPARLLTSRPATYPASARRAEVESDVPLEIVVAPDGGVISARVVAPHGYGLDGAALEAVRAYRFSPARRAGRPVAVRMRWTVQFRLR